MNSLAADDGCNFNTLNADCVDSGVVTIIPAGTVTGAIQLRSSTGKFAANEAFYYDTSKSALNGGTVYELLSTISLATQSEILNIPSWVKRITINCHNVQTNGTVKPFLSIGTVSGYDALKITGSCWGDSGAAVQNWDNIGVHFFNNAWLTTAYYRTTIVIEKIPSLLTTHTYTIKTLSNNYEMTNFAFGTGRFGGGSEPITKLKFSAGATSFVSAYWQIYIE